MTETDRDRKQENMSGDLRAFPPGGQHVHQPTKSGTIHTAWAAKKEELEATLLLENYDLVACTETWWKKLSVMAINGYRLFRRNWEGRRHGKSAFYSKRWIKCEGLSLQKIHGQVKSLWVRIRDKSNTGICCRSRGLYWQRLHAPAMGGITLIRFCPLWYLLKK